MAEIAAAGHERVLVLGDISDDGSPELIRAALAAIGTAGLTAWAVPGNHDAARDPRALELAAEPLDGCVVAAPAAGAAGRRDRPGRERAAQHRWRPTCAATSLPDVTALAAQLLVWAGHYPLVSQEAEVLRGRAALPGRPDESGGRPARRRTAGRPGPGTARSPAHGRDRAARPDAAAGVPGAGRVAARLDRRPARRQPARTTIRTAAAASRGPLVGGHAEQPARGPGAGVAAGARKLVRHRAG